MESKAKLGDVFLGNIGWALLGVPAVAVVFVLIRRIVRGKADVKYTHLASNDEEGDLEMEMRNL